MRLMIGSLCLALSLLATGCETYAEQVEREHAPGGLATSTVTIHHDDPPAGCVPMGIVEGRGMTYQEAVENLERQAMDVSANWVTLDAAHSGTVGHNAGGFVALPPSASGRAFHCSRAAFQLAAERTAAAASAATPPVPAAAPSAPADAPPAATCAPDCSPGYTCLAGRCVEACNPACVAPAVCGADRVCHR